MNNIRFAAFAALLSSVAAFGFDTTPAVYPTVSWVQPANNSTFANGSAIVLQANPSEQGGTISQVVFTIGASVIGTSKAAPWQIVWTPTAQGTYSVRALALDTANHGGSASINIMVGPSAGSSQSFSLTVINGTGGGPYAAGTVVTVSAVPPAGQVFQSWSGSGVANPALASFSYTMPSSNVVLTANCVTPQPPAIQTVSPLQVPLGVFAVNVTGTGFSGGTTAQLNGAQLTVTAFTATSLSVTGFAGAPGLFNFTVANGSASSGPMQVQVGVQTPLVSAAAARRFLEQAAFGATPADAAHLQTIGFQAWINEQFAMAPVSNYSAAPVGQSGLSTIFLANAVTNPDQLRQRVGFALSQIFVTSMMKLVSNQYMIPYQQMLLNDAFTNYRQILGDVTLSPGMGWYLDMANNAKANPVAGTAPNENYAREVMQLFTIGTRMLNPDGTPQKDASGLPIPTYGQTDVTELARVFTGWGFAPMAGGSFPIWGAFISSANVNYAVPMLPQPAAHDFGSKNLVNGYQEPANLSVQQDLQNALDNLATHPNTAPFISMQLIEHLIKSNPSPAYVSRVAEAFSQSGGDMKTVISAILLDPEARANDAGGGDQATDGHYQEPALLLPAFIRAFGGQMTTGNWFSSNLVSLGEDIYNAPSVFNYFSPSFVASGTGGLLGPEFQLDNPNAAVLRENLVANFFNQYSNPVQSYGPGTTVDLSPFVPLASNPATLLDALDLTLTHGTMPAGMKSIILNALNGEQISSLHRVETGIYLILMSGYYNVWH